MRPYSPGGTLNALAAARGDRPPTPSVHRLRLGLPGYLILFAPPAFAPQRRSRPRGPPSPPVFHPISAHSTATPGVPPSPTGPKPRRFRGHAALLGQACAHCPIFPTAASRRSLGRVSVPIWPVGLSTRLPVVGTVGRHPAVYLMGRGAIPSRRGFSRGAMRHPGVSGITRPFGRLSRGRGQVLHVLLSRSPLASIRR